MKPYHFIVTYEGEVEAPDPDTARTYAIEDVEAGRAPFPYVEVEPVTRKEPAR